MALCRWSLTFLALRAEGQTDQAIVYDANRSAPSGQRRSVLPITQGNAALCPGL